MIIDKVDMHLAMEMSSDLLQLAEQGIKAQFKTIITSSTQNIDFSTKNNESDSLYKQIKLAYFKERKALIIQINDEQRIKSKSKNQLQI